MGDSSKGLSAVIITGNPKFIHNAQAKKYYADIKAYLISLGVKDVSFDPCADYTCPKHADLYVAHSRGVSRARCVENTHIPFVKLGVPEGIIEPEDLKWQKENPPGGNSMPPPEHFEFSDAQKKGVRDAVAEAEHQKRERDKGMDGIASTEKLTAEQRRDLPATAFALPGRRYPIPDASHARAALSRASEMQKKGLLTKKEYDTVVRKAHAVLGKE